MKKLVAVTTTILIILIAVLGIFMIKGHGSDSSTAKSTLSDLKESLSDKRKIQRQRRHPKTVMRTGCMMVSCFT